MSETILNYVNDVLQLPDKIKNIEKEFRTGYLFGELISKLCKNPERMAKYIQKPKNNSEIKENFQNVKKDLIPINVYINDNIIYNIMEESEGAASKLIYKIKTEMERIGINFNIVMQKINENSYREKYELGKTNNFNNFNRTGLLEMTLSNKFPISPTITTRETLSTFTNFFFKPNVNNANNQKRVFINQDSINESKYVNYKNKVLLKPLKSSFKKSNEKEKVLKGNKTTFGSFKEFKNLKNLKKSKTSNRGEEITEKINDDYVNEKFNNISKINASTSEVQNITKKTKRNYSLSMNKRYKVKAKNKNMKNREDFFSYDQYVKYSILDINTKKIGININEVAPKLRKSGISHNNDYYLLPSQIINNFKSILSSKKEDDKNIIFNLKTNNKDQKLKSQEAFLKNSIINQNNNNEDQLISNKINKNSSQYKMKEYNRLIDSKNDHKNNFTKRIIIDSSYNKFQDESRPFPFDVDEYLYKINNEKDLNNNNTRQKKIKIKKPLSNYNIIKGVTNLIIDFVEECYKSQTKLEEELVEVPEYREWCKYFIEGKSCLKIPIRIRKDKIDTKKEKDSNNITNNSSILTKLTKKSENKPEKKATINNTELITTELNDYLFYRGNWEINNFINKNLYGTYLQIYNVLGNDIFSIIPNVDNLFHGVKPSIMLEKSNNEFELKEDELDNIFIPKSNIRNSLYGEIILLNYDNISNEIINNNVTLNLNTYSKYISSTNENDIKKDNNIEEEKNAINKEEFTNICLDVDFSYIPIKICLIGHSFSGRSTQAKLLTEKYSNLKAYSINEITMFYLEEYKRLHTPIEKNPKNKGMKKNQIDKMKEQMDEEIKKYQDIFSIIEKFINTKNLEENINLDEIPDELKINLLIYEIKKDFPEKNENEINEQIQQRNQKRQKLEEELMKLKEEINLESTNSNNTKDNKKPKNKSKKGNNVNSIQTVTEELDKIINESFEGFILYDYPNNYSQCLKLENMTTGFVQEIEEEPDKRDIYMNLLTNSIDKPYVNISNVNNEISSNLNKKKLVKNSFFNCYILLELSEEETLKRMNNRLKDPTTGIIYHKEYSPPNPADKKLNDRLIELTEPSNDKIKELITQFYLEYPKILYFVDMFKNFHKIEYENKDEIFIKIENIITNEIKKYEEQENKDTMGNLLNNNNDFNDENETIRYFVRLNETKKVISKDISEEIIKKWTDDQDKYARGVTYFIKNFLELKNNILEQMNNYQEEFIDYLNKASKKYKLVDIFYKKYNMLLEKFPYLKNNHLVQEEFEKNISELIDHIWELIQMRKRDSIKELNNIKNLNFIENQLELFGEYIINLIILETNQYYNKINIIKRFYYEFDNLKIAEKFPYNYTFQKDMILQNIEECPIFVADINSEESKTIEISPKINKIYNNCYKLFFDYDQKMASIYKKIKEENIMNSSDISTRSKRILKSHKRKNTIKSEMSSMAGDKNINYEEEMKAALNDEKIKYKIRILFLKKFAEKNLQEIYSIGQATFENLDSHIIESVNSQNNAMNELILKIKKNIKEGFNKLKVKDVELDLFDVYEKSNVNFTKFNLNYLYSIPEQDKKINYIDLHMIYLDVKLFEIQKNYATLNTIIDIVFKKHLFENKSHGFMKYMQQIPYYYLNIYINKFIIKTDNGHTLIKLNELFTSLALLNVIPPKNEQQIAMKKSINNKLKYNLYLTKEDFMNCKMWFEKDEENNHNNEKDEINESHKDNNYFQYMHNTSQAISNKGQNITDTPKEKKSKRSSRIMPQLNNRIASNRENRENKEISDEIKLKEFLFIINKNEEGLIDFMDFMKRIIIKKNYKRKKKDHFYGGSDIKSNIDKADILSQNSFMESIDKTQISESTTNYFKASKNLMANNLNNSNVRDENKFKSTKIQKLNETFKDFSDDKLNNNNELLNFLDYTYFDYLIKKT